jgi:hypothetical protein
MFDTFPFPYLIRKIDSWCLSPTKGTIVKHALKMKPKGAGHTVVGYSYVSYYYWYQCANLWVESEIMPTCCRALECLKKYEASLKTTVLWSVEHHVLRAKPEFSFRFDDYKSRNIRAIRATNCEMVCDDKSYKISVNSAYSTVYEQLQKQQHYETLRLYLRNLT